jgi:hypothetical protein
MTMKLVAAGVVAATVAFAGLGYAGATSVSGEQAAPANLHFLLRERIVPLDEAKPGPSDYERVLYRGSLLDPKTRKPRGTELGFCIAADVKQQSRLVCQIVFAPSATNSLAASEQITAQTIFDDVQTSKPQRTAITGGTGRYAGVRGEIVAKPAPGGLVDVVFRFRR